MEKVRNAIGYRVNKVINGAIYKDSVSLSKRIWRTNKKQLKDINKRKEKVSITQRILYLLIRLLFLIIYSLWVSFSVFFVTYLLYGD